MIFKHNTFLDDEAPVMVEMVVSVTIIVVDIVDVGVVDGDTITSELDVVSEPQEGALP